MDIYSVILEQQKVYKNWLNEPNSIEREMEPTYQNYLESPFVKVIMGPRRCGKSFFSIRSLSHEEIIYINFDDERFFDLTSNDLNSVYEEALRILPHPKYWVFDEIQNVEGWELFVNRLKRKGLNIIVTGSNSKLLSKELATHLTGRTLSLELMPFSFREYLRYYKFEVGRNILTEDAAALKNYFLSYMRNGGFPETFFSKVAPDYLRELFDRIITKDVIQRYQTRDPKTLRGISHIMLNYSSQELSYQKIKNSFSGLSINTLKKYITYLEETYLFSEIETYSTKIRERLTKTRKIYCIDTGLFNALSDNPNKTLERQLENLVYLELKRRKKIVSFFKTKNFEIDFIIQNENSVSELIQVCWELDSQKTREREFKGFSEAEKILGKKKKILLTFDTTEVVDDINVMPVWKWLLQ